MATKSKPKIARAARRVNRSTSNDTAVASTPSSAPSETETPAAPCLDAFVNEAVRQSLPDVVDAHLTTIEGSAAILALAVTSLDVGRARDAGAHALVDALAAVAWCRIEIDDARDRLPTMSVEANLARMGQVSP